jgi:hypothetical protein
MISLYVHFCLGPAPLVHSGKDLDFGGASFYSLTLLVYRRVFAKVVTHHLRELRMISS